MSDYFKPLRRKVGLVTLAMACLLTAGWVRSYCGGDRIIAIVMEGFESKNGYIQHIRIDLEGRGWKKPLVYRPDGTFCVPYWSICVPLTLLSAFLLLSKPRAAKPKSDSFS